MRRWFRGERGQAMVETAIVLPVVILLVFAVLDAGRIFSAWIVVTNGAREGARAASARDNQANILARIDIAMAGVDNYVPTITTADGNIPGPSGTPVTVSVDSDITLVTPLMAQFFGALVTVTGSATMQLE